MSTLGYGLMKTNEVRKEIWTCARIEGGNEGALSGLQAILMHVFEKAKGAFSSAMLAIDSNHGIPGDHVAMWHFAEHEEGIGDTATLAVHGDDEIGKEGVAVEATTRDVGMEALALAEGFELAA